MVSLAPNPAAVRKRVWRLLGHNRRQDRNELTNDILPRLSGVGSIALIGGAVRDVARLGGDRFRSDLDFVVYDEDRDAFHSLMEQLGGRPNRFGGFGLRYSRWRIDVCRRCS